MVSVRIPLSDSLERHSKNIGNPRSRSTNNRRLFRKHKLHSFAVGELLFVNTDNVPIVIRLRVIEEALHVVEPELCDSVVVRNVYAFRIVCNCS